MMNAAASHLVSICSAAASQRAVGPIVEVALAAEGAAPEWIQVFPKGPSLSAVDGRSWTLNDPATVIAAFGRTKLDLPIDYEHAQDRRAPQGEPAPAAGWIDRMEVRDGLVWGHVKWTARGAASVASREYRYLSPAFAHAKDGAVLGLVGAALVNRPAFDMPALAGAQPVKETTDMEKIIALLGLASTATADDIVAAIQKRATEHETALAAARTPSLATFVPRADYDVALARAQTAEQKIADAAKAALEADIVREVDAAVAAGKVTPATRDFYLSTCRADGGLEQFKKFVAAAPSLTGQSDLSKKQPEDKADKTDVLTPEMKAIAAQMRIDHVALAASLKSAD